MDQQIMGEIERQARNRATLDQARETLARLAARPAYVPLAPEANPVVDTINHRDFERSNKYRRYTPAVEVEAQVHQEWENWLASHLALERERISELVGEAVGEMLGEEARALVARIEGRIGDSMRGVAEVISQQERRLEILEQTNSRLMSDFEKLRDESLGWRAVGVKELARAATEVCESMRAVGRVAETVKREAADLHASHHALLLKAH
jgi:hypothetical protein